MNKTLMKIVPNVVIGKVSRAILKSKKNSPHIFFAAGVVGAVASTVLACRATLKLSVTLDEISEDLEAFKNITAAEEYMAADYHRDAAYVYTLAAVKLTKLYGPSVLIGTASVVALTGSHVQLSRRNSALMAAYAAIHQAFNEYRARVQAEIGEERELEVYHDATPALLKDGAGNEVPASIVDPNKLSVYAKFFDEYSRYWKKDPELNRIFIQCQQAHANNILIARGYLFLNEAYEMLGIDHSSAGQIVGWYMGGDGDNYVDFGLFAPGSSRFTNGFERSILLDFNVDGVVYDKI